MRYYYPPRMGADLSKGFNTFQQLDEGADGHLDGLLQTIMNLERRTDSECQANFMTWRGMVTKIMAAPFDTFNGWAYSFSRPCLDIDSFKLRNECDEVPSGQVLRSLWLNRHFLFADTGFRGHDVRLSDFLNARSQDQSSEASLKSTTRTSLNQDKHSIFKSLVQVLHHRI